MASLMENILNQFGFEIKKDKEQEKKKELISFTEPEADGSVVVQTQQPAVTTAFLRMDEQFKNVVEMITKYRQLAVHPECETAIDDVINEAIVLDKAEQPVKIVLDDVKAVNNKVKDAIVEEFDEILKLLEFKDKGYEIFRKWYVDGRIYYHKMIDLDNPKRGILDLRYIDPRKIQKVEEMKSPAGGAGKNANIGLYQEIEEYYIYNENGLVDASQGLKIAPDTIAYVHSGIIDFQTKTVRSHLHKAIKPHNQLTMMEDSTVIYRLVRAPERRVYYIDVGNLPSITAEREMHKVMHNLKNKLSYDVDTGKLANEKKFMTMTEDIFLPRRDGRGTEVDTLPGGQNLGEMDDVEYFRKKLYKSLNVPISRLETDTGFSLGRSEEITRDEVKFNRFIIRLRAKFSSLFDQLLETQLLLKNIVTPEEWTEMKQNIYYDFLEDNQFTELKDAEVLQNRLGILTEIDEYTGKYFSIEWIRKNVIRQDDEEIKLLDKQMENERDMESEFEMDDNGGFDKFGGGSSIGAGDTRADDKETKKDQQSDDRESDVADRERKAEKDDEELKSLKKNNEDEDEDDEDDRKADIKKDRESKLKKRGELKKDDKGDNKDDDKEIRKKREAEIKKKREKEKKNKKREEEVEHDEDAQLREVMSNLIKSLE